MPWSVWQVPRLRRLLPALYTLQTLRDEYGLDRSGAGRPDTPVALHAELQSFARLIVLREDPGLALRDVDRALESGACTTDQMIIGYLLRGHSRFTTEDYTAALDAYSDGLTFDPMHSELLACVRKARGMTSQRRLKRKAREESSGAQSGPAGASAGSQQSECDLPDAAASGSGDDDERGRKSLTCSLCRKLMFDPVTAPTGNSFCRNCLQRALAEKPVCPVTQKVIHMNARRFPVRLSRSRVLFEPARTTVR